MQAGQLQAHLLVKSLELYPRRLLHEKVPDHGYSLARRPVQKQQAFFDVVVGLLLPISCPLFNYFPARQHTWFGSRLMRYERVYTSFRVPETDSTCRQGSVTSMLGCLFWQMSEKYHLIFRLEHCQIGLKWPESSNLLHLPQAR
jgi:hypothetical protein